MTRPTPAHLAAACLLGLAAAHTQAEELGTITVESTTIDDRFEAKRDEPSNIGAISGSTVDAAHTENVQQLLQGIPGITTEVESGDSIKIHIRGVENQVYMGEKPGVAVVIDGVPVFERTGRVNIDLDDIESIKVIKGGASYLFGDDALAGAVIITTKRGAKQAGVRVAAEGGSFGYYKGLGRVGVAGGKGSAHIQVSRRQTDGYYEDSASRADYVNGKAQLYLDDMSDLTFGFELAKRKKNSHGSVRGVTAAHNDPRSTDPAYNDYASHFDVELQKYFLTYARDFGQGGNLMVNGYRFSDNTKFLTAPLDADPSAYSNDNDYAQVQQGLKSELRMGGRRLAWMAGLDLRANSYDNKVTKLDCSEAWGACTVGALSGNNATDEKVAAVYGELKLRAAEALVFTANARGDHIALDYTDHLTPSDNGGKTFDVASGRLGANLALSANLDLYSNASTGFRAPSVTQLFTGSSSPTQATDPNPNLKPENTVNLELGLRARGAPFGVGTDLDLAVFQLDRYDHVQSTAGQYTTSADNIYANIGDMRSRGLELSLRTDAARLLSLDLAYTYLDAYYTRYDNFNLKLCSSHFHGHCVYSQVPFDVTGNQVPRTPHHHLNAALRIHPAAHWLLTAEVDASSRYYADEINQLKIGGHGELNLLLNYDRPVGNSGLSLFARVDNVFDRRYFNTARVSGDSNDDGVYNAEDISIVVNPGRRYTAGLSLSF